MNQTPVFRFAEEEDTPLILQFIRELADYEGMLGEVVADEATLKEWIFRKQKAEVLFVLADGREVGFALFFHNFSTFLGRFISGGSVCEARVPRPGLRQGDSEEAGGHRGGAGLRPPGMVVPGLEQAQH